jgi:hypothetical protein
MPRVFLASQAYQLAVALPSSASSGQCVPITVKSQDSAGVDKALLRSANFNISSPNNGMSFFSSGSCTGTSLSSFAFAPGTSQYTVYAKLIAAGSLDLQINGDSVDFNIPYLSKNMVVTPGPLSINATPISGSILANNSAQFLITGGKPPFTIQGSHANIQGSNINSSAEGYVLNLTFGVSAIGATSLGILDSMGATTTLNITIAP